MKPPAAVFITQDALKQDNAFTTRGKRKIVVTRCYQNETYLTTPRWLPGSAGDNIPVLVGDNMEISYFTETAKQDCHRHRNATEIYNVQSGGVTIVADGETYHLNPGDTLVVLPGTNHEVMKSDSPFLCQVIAVNVSPADKIVMHTRTCD